MAEGEGGREEDPGREGTLCVSPKRIAEKQGSIAEKAVKRTRADDRKEDEGRVKGAGAGDPFVWGEEEEEGGGMTGVAQDRWGNVWCNSG